MCEICCDAVMEQSSKPGGVRGAAGRRWRSENDASRTRATSSYCSLIKIKSLDHRQARPSRSSAGLQISSGKMESNNLTHTGCVKAAQHVAGLSESTRWSNWC